MPGKIRILSLFVAVVALALAASAAEQAKTESGADGWPHVAKIQVKHQLPREVRTNEADGEMGMVEAFPWGGCNSNNACGLTNNGCYLRPYATCQDRLAGSGDPCQGC
jgi:hypothetical protein